MPSDKIPYTITMAEVPVVISINASPTGKVNVTCYDYHLIGFINN